MIALNQYRSLESIQNALNKAEFTLKALVQAYLEQIEKNKDLNVFVEVFAEEALAKAEALDLARKNGEKTGALSGMVLAIKDNICYKDHKVNAGSKILEGFTSLYTATSLQRLIDQDVIVIGRTNCDEFAMGSSNETSYFGRVKHPLNPELVPGGSSGGSAAAVAADMCLASLGSDTGGSIRQPASFCGIVGMKPTYGTISRYGLIAYASSFDQIGPFSHSVADSAILLSIMSGKDGMDATTINQNSLTIDLKPTDKKLKLAVIKDCLYHPAVDAAIKAEFIAWMDDLKSQGHEIVEIDFDLLDYMVPTYYVLTTAEASSNLSRFGGVNYGHRSSKANNIETTFSLSRAEGFGKEVQRRIMLGTFVLSAGFYDAYYAKGQKVRRLIKSRTEDIFKEVDFIITPTTPKSAFKSGAINDPITMYLEDIFTVWSNLAGCPSISLPLGKNAIGLPAGFQIMAADRQESKLMAFSQNCMK